MFNPTPWIKIDNFWYKVNNIKRFEEEKSINDFYEKLKTFTTKADLLNYLELFL